jgi:hypothetical protein
VRAQIIRGGREARHIRPAARLGERGGIALNGNDGT